LCTAARRALATLSTVNSQVSAASASPATCNPAFVVEEDVYEYDVP
jgi:hypothetical protein